MDQVKFFKGCLPQILLGPFLNTLSHFGIVIPINIKVHLNLIYFEKEKDLVPYSVKTHTLYVNFVNFSMRSFTHVPFEIYFLDLSNDSISSYSIGERFQILRPRK